MQKYAVKIDLSSFFSDERQHALILVDPSWLNVEMLQQRVEAIFNVQNVRFQTNDGYFLPSEESIEVVKFVEQLKAFIPHTALKEKRKKSKHREEQESYEDLQGALAKRKCDAFNCSTPNIAKRSKNLNSIVMGESIKEGVACELKQPNTEPSSNSLKKKKKKNISSTAISLNNSTNTASESTSKKLPTTTEKKMHESKQTNGNATHVYFNDSGQVINGDGNKEETQNEPTVVKVSKKIAVHFRCALNEQCNRKARIFNIGRTSSARNSSEKAQVEIQEIVVLKPVVGESRTNNTKITNNEVVHHALENSNRELDVLLLSNHNVTLQQQQNTTEEDQKQNEPSNLITVVHSLTHRNDSTVKELEQTCLMNDEGQHVTESLEKTEQSNFMDDDEQETTNCTAKEMENLEEVERSTFIDDESSVIAIDDDDDDDVTFEGTSSNAGENAPIKLLRDEIKIKTILPFCTQLDKLPNNGDVVVFKLTLSNGRLSNYIAGKCEFINKRMKSIKILILDGHEEWNRIPFKFQINLDDSMNTEKYITVKLSDLSNAKVLRK